VSGNGAKYVKGINTKQKLSICMQSCFEWPLWLFPTSGLEPESCVVGRPAALTVAQYWRKTGCDVTQILIPFRGWKRIAESVGEGSEPRSHACRKGSRPRNNSNVVHMKARCRKPLTILIGRRKIPRHSLRRVGHVSRGSHKILNCSRYRGSIYRSGFQRRASFQIA